jgi:paraquat-inducible protein B
MSRSANPTVIGSFVLGAAVLAVVAVLTFGSGRFFEKRLPFVLYFDSSVFGLDLGAPVIFQGVQVGTVKSISAQVNGDTGAVAVPVYIEVVQGRVTVVGGVGRESVGGVQREIGRGLRAQLKSQSLITGKLYVDLNYFPNKPAVYKHADADTPEIPTVPTEMEEIRSTLTGIIDKIRALPLKDLVDKLAGAATGLDKLLNKPELDHAIDELDGALGEARAVLTKVDARVDPLADSAEGALDEAKVALKRIESAVDEVKGMLQEGSPVRYELVAALEEVARAARSIRVLADDLADDPDSLIFGKGKSGD